MNVNNKVSNFYRTRHSPYSEFGEKINVALRIPLLS